eukprot:6800580-Prymnesium_polylepis.1
MSMYVVHTQHESTTHLASSCQSRLLVFASADCYSLASSKPTGMAASSLLMPQSRLCSRNETTAPTRISQEWPSRAASPCAAQREASALERRMACASCA